MYMFIINQTAPLQQKPTRSSGEVKNKKQHYQGQRGIAFSNNSLETMCNAIYVCFVCMYGMRVRQYVVRIKFLSAHVYMYALRSSASCHVVCCIQNTIRSLVGAPLLLFSFFVLLRSCCFFCFACVYVYVGVCV